MVADTHNEIPGDRRRRTSGYIIVELLQLGLRLGVEDNLVLHPLLGFRLLHAMTRLQPREDRVGRAALRWILPEFSQAPRYLLAQPFLPLRLEILEHAQARADNLAGIVVAA